MSAVSTMRAVMRMQVQMIRRHAEMVTMMVMRMGCKARGRTGRGFRTLAPVTNASLMPFRPTLAGPKSEQGGHHHRHSGNGTPLTGNPYEEDRNAGGRGMMVAECGRYRPALTPCLHRQRRPAVTIIFQP